MMHEGVVFIDTSRLYYARWSRTLRMRTNAFTADELLSPYWVEIIRVAPETIKGPDE